MERESYKLTDTFDYQFSVAQQSVLLQHLGLIPQHESGCTERGSFPCGEGGKSGPAKLSLRPDPGAKSLLHVDSCMAL